MGLFFAEAKVLLALLARDYDMTAAAGQEDEADVAFQIDFNANLKIGAVKFSRLQEASVAA